MDLNVYIIKFTAITDSLISKHALSDLDHIGRLFDGLNSDLRPRVLKFCVKKSWKLSSHDTGTNEPNFEELKWFVLLEAKAAQKQTVYNNERAIWEGNEPATSTSTTSILTPTVNISVLSKPSSTQQPSTLAPVSPPDKTSAALTGPTADPIAELTKQFSQLALLIQGNMQPPRTNTIPATGFPNPISRCIWCDSTDHMKRQCTEVTIAAQMGLIRDNLENRIVDGTMGQEIPPMFNRGGMKQIFGAPHGTSTLEIRLWKASQHWMKTPTVLLFRNGRYLLIDGFTMDTPTQPPHCTLSK